MAGNSNRRSGKQRTFPERFIKYTRKEFSIAELEEFIKRLEDEKRKRKEKEKELVS